ncbi:MAG: N-acetyl-gamma-glutamyl-phosphate reductase [Thiotrichales bacterium]|nr:N-acetyl-gamma-glutamyl-phosphate reductase [Thiotrichales bacterium]
MIKTGIVGATGYTGGELLRLLLQHPQAEILTVTSDAGQGKPVVELFPSLRGATDLQFSPHDTSELSNCDVVFFATPNATAMHRAASLLDTGVRIVDLSADFRLKDAELWSGWYGEPHASPDLLDNAVYGLPEINREHIAAARLVANPGCYPTSITLGLLPALLHSLIKPQGLIADAKSGISGAGRKAALTTQFAEVDESFSAYSAGGHRHHPEIAQTLESVCGESIDVTFVPHLVPMVRGIHATIYAELDTESTDVQTVYEKHYQDEPFVDVLPAGSHPDTRSTRGSNVCRIAVHQPGNGRRLIVLSVIDNLVKGAAGQAVQNMNIMYGMDETSGLTQTAIVP